MERNEHTREPYPSLEGTVANCRLACELARSHIGELNSVSEYIYQSIMFEETMPELSDIFDELAMDEMNHFRLLGELIRTLGGDPALRTAVRNSGGLVMREDKGCRAYVAASRELRRHIADELAAYNEYMRLAALSERMGQLPAAALLRRIAADEREHRQRQEELLR